MNFHDSYLLCFFIYVMVIAANMENDNIKCVVAMSIYKNDDLSFLKCAINSVIEQLSVSHKFCIVIDGPVSDEINDYIDSVKEYLSCVLVNRLNKGLAFSMNRIIDYIIQQGWSSVDYFFRMDADDICFPDRFIKQLNYMNDNKLHVVGSQCLEINSDGDVIGYRNMPIYHQDIVNSMPRRCVINHPTALIHFCVFRAGFRYDSGLTNTQDYYLWAELLANNFRFGNIPEPLLYFRRNDDFFSRRGRKKALNDLRARFNMMRKLNSLTFFNVCYALMFFILRMMPKSILKWLYVLNAKVGSNG